MSKSKLAETLKATENMLAQLRELAAAHQRFPVEPESGAVIRFTKRFPSGSKGYSYAALRIGPRWYLTGARSSSSGRPGNWMPFDELVEFIGDGKAWVSEGWTEVPTLNPEIQAGDGAERLAELAAALTNTGDKTPNEVAQNLLEIFRGWSDDPGAVENIGAAQFRGQVYPDM